MLLTYWAALAFAARRGAFLAAAFMAASILLMVEAQLAKTDAVLAACCVAAFGALARAYLARGTRPPPAADDARLLGAASPSGSWSRGRMVLLFAGLARRALSIRERSGALAPRPAAGHRGGS